MEKFILIYVLILSLISVTVTCYDKYAAKKRPRDRIPENTLLLLALLGGAVAMYMTMQAARHKTLHKKFMIGLPVIIACHIAIIYFALSR